MCYSWELGAVPTARNQKCCAWAPLLAKKVEEAATPAAKTTAYVGLQTQRDRRSEILPLSRKERYQANC